MGGTQPTPRRHLPEATVARLPLYLRCLDSLREDGTTTASSQLLADGAGVTSAQVRKDLSHLGSQGTRGVGYDVARLAEEIGEGLGLGGSRAVVLVGVGHLGQALAGYAGFRGRGFTVAALVDSDPAVVGTLVAGITVEPLESLAEVVARHEVTLGVVATPAAAAQQVCDALVAAGVRSLLLFAPGPVAVSPGVEVRLVDLALELQILSFHEHRRRGATPDQHGRGAVVAVEPYPVVSA